MLYFPAEKLSPFISKIRKKWNFIFTKFTSGYYLLIINKLLSKFGRNPGLFEKVIQISKTLTTEWIFVDAAAADNDDDGMLDRLVSLFRLKSKARQKGWVQPIDSFDIK